MTAVETLFLIAPGAALLLLLSLITTARPDPTRAVHVAPDRPRRSGGDRRRRRDRAIPI